MILQHLDKNNLHHAYLFEGERDEILPLVIKFIESLKIKIINNPDFCQISVDFLTIKQALDLRAMAVQKSFTDSKKIFVVLVNRFSKDAEGVLLKMFEEPIEGTHFFVITPDVHSLEKTLLSRFYLISTRQDLAEKEIKEAEKFIKMSLRDRLDFIKEFVAVSEDKDDDDIIEEDSVRSNLSKFLNALEFVLHKRIIQPAPKALAEDMDYISHIFKVREYLRLPGSATKTLLESVAIAIPIL